MTKRSRCDMVAIATVIVMGVTSFLSIQVTPTLALEYNDLEVFMKRNEEQQQQQLSDLDYNDLTFKKKIRMDAFDDVGTISLRQEQVNNDLHRILQGADTPSGEQQADANCYSSIDRDKPNRYCVIDDSPRENTFLVLACPTISGDNDYSNCACAVGIGEPEDAPNTETCTKCTFCSRDSTLAYDCRNVAEGTCIGINCNGECVSSLVPEAPLEDLSRSEATQTTTLSMMGSLLVMIAVLLVNVNLQ